MTTLADKIEALPDIMNARIVTIDKRETEYIFPASLKTEILRALRERDQAVEALRTAEAAIAEYHRYWTGGETRGSYDGKPERNGLWNAQRKARQTLASIEGTGHE